MKIHTIENIYENRSVQQNLPIQMISCVHKKLFGKHEVCIKSPAIWHLIAQVFHIQGVSHWNVFFELALRGRRTDNLVKLLCLVASGGVGICVSYTSFKKSNIGWPQQPQTEKVLKFKMVFCDSTPNSIFSKHQNKAEIQNLDDFEVLINDFSGIRTFSVGGCWGQPILLFYKIV